MRRTLILALALLGCGSGVESSSLKAPGTAAEVEPAPADAHVHWQKGKANSNPTPLADHGGKILPVSHTYAIWWGDPSAFPADASDLETLLSGIGTTSYLAIADQYMRGGSAASSFIGGFHDPSAPPSHGPKTSTMVDEACKVINANGLTADAEALYAIFTSNFPKVNYCAWHSHGTCNGVDIQVAYLPNTGSVSGCDVTASGTNLNCRPITTYTRSVADSLAHEFMETVTDPDISAWYDANGQEIGDKCNFHYTSCVSVGGLSWQIQAEWSNAANGCVQQ